MYVCMDVYIHPAYQRSHPDHVLPIEDLRHQAPWAQTPSLCGEGLLRSLWREVLLGGISVTGASWGVLKGGVLERCFKKDVQQVWVLKMLYIQNEGV